MKGAFMNTGIYDKVPDLISAPKSICPKYFRAA